MKPLEYSNVYVIESLKDGERKTGTELYNDIIRRRMEQKNLAGNCELIDNIEEKVQFFAAMEKIIDDEKNLLANPIIHFEMHGGKQGLELANGDFITWQELQFFLVQINGICGNNLFITMASCFGGYVYTAINPSFISPFWGFIGPFEEVGENEIMANYGAFYNEFLQSSDFQAAEQALHASNPATFSRFRLHNTELVFEKAYRNYEVFHLKPERIEERLDQMVAECRPKAEFNNWSDQQIRDWGRYIMVNEKNILKKNLMRKFFMLDVFPDQTKYYNSMK